jgi:nicotinamidase-related amidase
MKQSNLHAFLKFTRDTKSGVVFKQFLKPAHTSEKWNKREEAIHMRAYLIVVDMQNDFIDGALGTAEAVSVIPAVIEKIETHLAGRRGPVIFTRDTHGDDYLGTEEGIRLPVVHCTKGSSGWMLHPEIDILSRREGCRIFDKPTFGSIALAEYLRERHAEQPIESIELIGLCTDICVIANALLLKTFLPDILIRVNGACCAGVTPESHENALVAMRMCQIEVCGAAQRGEPI